MHRNRTVLMWALALACAAGAVIALADIRTPARVVLVPLFLVVVPGASVVGLLRDRDPLAALTVGAAASLVINVLLAEAMLMFDAWSPRAGVATIAVLGGFMWVLRSLYRGNGSVRTEQGAGSR
ncbi:hypothetical protein Sme01_52170 [Sphaerisporangium melleum]|uniref:Uncharacterized protein n=1 Tax=Sphaerisporangium melleum TaxID=321316 RepID=A0A917QYC9_9ACTN|nr:hypothetical protein [Sphaerisporangium melleum]GGK76400.1 hypothetical protein GCM10007964_18930 [Sphaerisporangium melleum]GII72741.1 hypothetical protein Sme01_52170 [Sphaerisporangium melleum]